jgi:hypothetical protein
MKNKLKNFSFKNSNLIPRSIYKYEDQEKWENARL